MWFDALPENCFFYVFSLYEFLHSLDLSRLKTARPRTTAGGRISFSAVPAQSLMVIMIALTCGSLSIRHSHGSPAGPATAGEKRSRPAFGLVFAKRIKSFETRFARHKVPTLRRPRGRKADFVRFAPKSTLPSAGPVMVTLPGWSLPRNDDLRLSCQSPSVKPRRRATASVPCPRSPGPFQGIIESDVCADHFK